MKANWGEIEKSRDNAVKWKQKREFDEYNTYSMRLLQER